MSRLKLVIGNKAYSSWSMRPWLLMTHAGIDFEEERLSLYQPGARERLLRHSGAAKVPVLKDGAVTVWDSLAICEYLSEKYPAKQLWPKDAAARAHARAVAAEMHSGFTSLRSQMPMNVRRQLSGRARSPEVLADIARITAIWAECRAGFGGAGPFLYGAFSIADAMYAPVATRFRTYGIELDGVAAQYASAILGLPAMAKWISDANAETEVNPQYE